MSWRFWVLLALLAGLLAGHGAILYYVSSHLTFSAAVLSGAIMLLVVKYLLLRRYHSEKRM